MGIQRRRRTSLVVALSCCLAVLGLAPLRASVVDLCAFSGTATEPISRGVIVPKYEGTNLRSMELRYGANVPGSYRITIEVHRGTFDGPLVAASQTAYVDLGPGNIAAGRASSQLALRTDLGGSPFF